LCQRLDRGAKNEEGGGRRTPTPTPTPTSTPSLQFSFTMFSFWFLVKDDEFTTQYTLFALAAKG
jgi:hypothetical protein